MISQSEKNHRYYLRHREAILLKKRAMSPDRTARANRLAYLVMMQQVHAYLVDHPCVDCGKPYGQGNRLSFHHPNNSQKVGEISRMVHRNMSIEEIECEIGKCIVLCQSCHMKRHWKERREKNAK